VLSVGWLLRFDLHGMGQSSGKPAPDLFELDPRMMDLMGPQAPNGCVGIRVGHVAVGGPAGDGSVPLTAVTSLLTKALPDVVHDSVRQVVEYHARQIVQARDSTSSSPTDLTGSQVVELVATLLGVDPAESDTQGVRQRGGTSCCMARPTLFSLRLYNLFMSAHPQQRLSCRWPSPWPHLSCVWHLDVAL